MYLGKAFPTLSVQTAQQEYVPIADLTLLNASVRNACLLFYRVAEVFLIAEAAAGLVNDPVVECFRYQVLLGEWHS